MKNSLHRVKRIFILRIGLIAALLLSWLPGRTGSAAGTDRYVAPGGVNNPGCTLISAPCLTVQYAIDQAVNFDTIHIAAGTYSSVHLTTSKALSFSGAGKDTTILDGGNTGIVFTISGAIISISDLTIQHGNAGVSFGGGAIRQTSGSLIINRVKIYDNQADWGAGIYSAGDLNITDSEIGGNRATLSASSFGGGLYSNGTGTSTSLTNVTFFGNQASANSAGIQYQSNNLMSGLLIMTNVTITANTAFSHSAGVITNNGQAIIINSTIAGNFILGGAGSFNGGLGVFASTTFKNSIVALNDGQNCAFSNGSLIHSEGNNISSDDSCRFFFSGVHDREAIDPMLTMVAYNGGPVPTVALRQGSPAIDGVTYQAPNGCPAKDARGINRPFGTYCDIGAYEVNTAWVYLPLIKK